MLRDGEVRSGWVDEEVMRKINRCFIIINNELFLL